jgi:hypothetical protein
MLADGKAATNEAQSSSTKICVPSVDNRTDENALTNPWFRHYGALPKDPPYTASGTPRGA